MLNKKWFSKRELIIVLVSVPIFVIIRYFTSDSIGNVINLLCNIAQCFVIPLFFEWKSRKYIIPILIFGNILNFVFQLICVITKNIGIKFISDSTLLSLIFLIDTYIMLALYYLYSIIKGDKHMSWVLNYFFGKPIATLEKMKETRTKKIEKPGAADHPQKSCQIKKTGLFAFTEFFQNRTVPEKDICFF